MSKKATPASDSLAAVSNYVHNAKAVLDSLNSYEFLKVRTVQLRTDLQSAQKESLGLKLQAVRLRVSLDSCHTANNAVVRQDGKLKAARTENWVWRGVGLLVLVDLASKIVNAFK